VRFKAAGTEIGGIVDIRTAGAFLPGPQLGAPHRVPRGRRRDRFAMMKRLADNHGIRTTELAPALTPIEVLASVYRMDGLPIGLNRGRRPRSMSS
jgi:hypothetical protein